MICNRCQWTTLFLSLCLLNSCTSSSPPPQPHAWHAFPARDNGITFDRPLIYRAIVPTHWQIIESDPTLSIKDTTKPMAEFLIQDTIRLTIHSFPIDDSHPSIPPIAQVNRWKQQFNDLDLLSTHITKEAHGGYGGLFIEASGDGQILLAWSMQLAPEYARQLSLKRHPHDAYKMADYTIKAVGPSTLMPKHRQEIILFANSFELIDELPSP